MNRFLGLEDADGANAKAPFQILPVPYEKTVTYGTGCAKGPAAIIHASREVELFDEELESEPYRVGIGTLDPLGVSVDGPEAMSNDLQLRVESLLASDKTVITLGGEHSITPGAVRACQEKFPDLSVLQIDAHADLRDGYQGFAYSHASAMRRVRDTVATTVGVGIRNLCREEFDYYRQHDGCQLYFAHQRDADGLWINEAIDALSPNVYITLDLDGLDVSIMPAVGTPEPGGLSWEEVCGILRRVSLRRNIVAADVVELAPIEGMHAPDFVAARLVYKMIGYIDRGRKAVRQIDKT